ncbi:MAG: hypothetical protein M0006_06950 [Magnetospirillum sp.]|nr:hypothetical protein [Magnetospirillum sp.]
MFNRPRRPRGAAFGGPLTAAALALAMIPNAAWACACGCGVFDVGTSSMFPSGAGGMAFVEYDYMNQNRNWSGSSSAPAANNSDKKIETSFVTAGAQYMINRDWGVMAEIPYWDRNFTTTTDAGNIASFQHSSIGDVRLMGMYTGLSADMSTGILFGAKLPTGDYTYPNFDRDTEIGTGSTDTLLGAYHMGALTTDGAWDWFGQVMWDQPVLFRGGYHPGAETDAAVGVYYNGWTLGSNAKIAPLLQLIGSYRSPDNGPAGDPFNTGYSRVLIAPGVELDVGAAKIYADVEPPIYQDMRGNQLVAQELVKVIVSYGF